MAEQDDIRLSQFWDALVAGAPDAVDIDRSIADPLRHAHSLFAAPKPASARERARQRIVASDARSQETEMSTLTLNLPSLNGHSVLSPPAPRPMVQPVTKPPLLSRRALLSLAAAMLIAFAGIGGYLAQERFFGDDSAPAVIPSIQATPEGGWPQFRGDAARTGYTADPGPGGNFNLRWTFTAPEVLGGGISDGTSIYVYGRKGDLYALDAVTGAQRWGVDLSSSEYSDENRWPAPAVQSGIIYTGTYEGNMVALDVTDGGVVWQRALSTFAVVASPAIVDDALYVVTPEGTIVALDLATGATNWEWNGETQLSNWASAVGGGLLYIADLDGSLVAIDTATGETRWVAELGDARRNPAYADGTVYVGGEKGSFYALDATDGSVLWTSEPFTGDQTLNPVVTPTLLIATWANGPMKALDRETGAVVWEAEGPGNSVSPTASATTVYSVSRDLTAMVAYDLATGKELGRMDAEGIATAAPSGETMVSGSYDDPGVVRSFGPGEGEPIAVTAGPTTALEPATFIAAEAPADVASESTFDASQGDFVWDMTTIGETTLQGPAPTVGPNGSLYVANLNGTTFVLSPDGELIDQLDGAGTFGFDADGNIYLFDTFSNKIKKFAPDHTLLKEWGSSGSGNGQFEEIQGTVDPVNGLVYAVDFGNNRVQVFDLDGNFLDKWGSTGHGDGEFIHPVSVKVGPDGLVYVGEGPENGASRVQVFDRFGTFKGTLLDADGNTAIFSEVYGIAFDSAGNIYASDYFAHAIRVFDPQWREIGAIADVEGAGPFTYPIMLAIDADDNLYAGDFFGDGDLGRIVKLALPPTK